MTVEVEQALESMSAITFASMSKPKRPESAIDSNISSYPMLSSLESHCISIPKPRISQSSHLDEKEAHCCSEMPSSFIESFRAMVASTPVSIDRY